MAAGWYHFQFLTRADITCGAFLGSAECSDTSYITSVPFHTMWWLKLITSAALYPYYNVERQRVDGFDFITSHEERRWGGLQPWSMYCCSASKLSNISTIWHIPPLSAKTNSRSLPFSSWQLSIHVDSPVKDSQDEAGLSFDRTPH